MILLVSGFLKTIAPSHFPLLSQLSCIAAVGSWPLPSLCCFPECHLPPCAWNRVPFSLAHAVLCYSVTNAG